MTAVFVKAQGTRMDLQLLKDMIPLFISGLVTLGGGIAFLINRMDRKNKEEREYEKLERDKLEKLFADQIKSLEDKVSQQNDEIMQLRYELTVYVHHVGTLEGILNSKGVKFPELVIDKIAYTRRKET